MLLTPMSIFDTDVFGCTVGGVICSVSLVRIETPRWGLSLGAAFGFGFSRMADGCSSGGVCAGVGGRTDGANLPLLAVTGWRSGVIVGASETDGFGGMGAAGSDG